LEGMGFIRTLYMEDNLIATGMVL